MQEIRKKGNTTSIIRVNKHSDYNIKLMQALNIFLGIPNKSYKMKSYDKQMLQTSFLAKLLSNLHF